MSPTLSGAEARISPVRSSQRQVRSPQVLPGAAHGASQSLQSRILSGRRSFTPCPFDVFPTPPPTAPHAGHVRRRGLKRGKRQDMRTVSFNGSGWAQLRDFLERIRHASVVAGQELHLSGNARLQAEE
eukprot:568086-Pyramimonas_sp.AAC.1